jgi:hypothetical protein
MAKKSFVPRETAEPQEKSKDLVPNRMIHILSLDHGEVQIQVVGVTPLILHQMSEKAMQEILFPGAKANKVERETTLKHDPPEEFRQSPLLLRSPGATLIGILGSAFKGALRNVALRTPGAQKVQIGILTRVLQSEVPVWGTPYLHMARVIQSGFKGAPDIRTRAILPDWAAEFTVRFSRPALTADTVLQLFANAGQIIGVGDWRNEKGSGDYGLWRIVEAAEFREVTKVLGGQKEQREALKHPVPYDDTSTRLLTYFQEENARRQLKPRDRTNTPTPARINGRGQPEEDATL